MAASFTILLMVLQIVIQLAVVCLSYIIYNEIGRNKIWLSVSFAVILMTARRITALLIEIGTLPQITGTTIKFLDAVVLPFLISVLLLIGFKGLIQSFKKEQETGNSVDLSFTKPKSWRE